MKEIPVQIEQSIHSYRFREALKFMMDLARLGNKYLADTEPWKLIKTDESRVQTILHISLQITANLAILCEPFLPFTSAKLKALLKVSNFNWEQAGKHTLLQEGHTMAQPELLFALIEDTEIQQQIDKLEATRLANEANEKPVLSSIKPNIEFDDFAKLDIRTATILEAEKVPKTTKLLKLKLEVGTDQRTVVSGIAEYYEPQDIIGKQVCIVANLAPRKLKGIESQGMILMAEDKDGKLLFVSPENAMINGGMVK